MSGSGLVCSNATPCMYMMFCHNLARHVHLVSETQLSIHGGMVLESFVKQTR